ncbi:MAG: N(4)-(beta-N-acetylglucosaminyl)-L-asparaginase [Rhodothermales bacterium]|nr:N(4)-(beta-N-acetylglucosaminyl)-L-asparaginase [Rhodothermales bacterium]
MNRRKFFRSGAGISAGLFVAAGARPKLSAGRSIRTGATTRPVIITSHSNSTGQDAMRKAWEILAADGSALDAVEKGANVIEVDPEDTSVGYGGLPNEQGVVQLDASIMDGRTYNAGSVASIEGIKTPASIARLVMERTDHVMLVGPAALDFAKSFGYKEEDLMTEKARGIWLRWREQHSDKDDWGPAEHLVGREEATRVMDGPMDFHYGTTNVLAVDSNGDIAGITTTSGLSWKVPGRIGDSPIIGAGLYVDNKVGAAGATGRGEDVIKSCASYFIVMQMRAGRTPQEACEDAIEMIIDKYADVNPDFVPPEKFVALNKDGEYGCAWMGIRGTPRMSVHTPEGVAVFEGSSMYDPVG